MSYLPKDEWMIEHAIAEIESTYGDVVSVMEKKKSLVKFGLNSSVGTSRSTIMQLQGSEVHETYVTGNDITHVVCTDNTFTGTVRIEGHTITGGNLVFTAQTVTLTGQTAAALGTAIARATRIYINDGVSSLATAADVIYVYEGGTTTNGVPDTASETHLLMDGEYYQSEKCSTSISSSDYWLITKIYAGLDKKTAASVDIELQVRTYTEPVFRTLFKLPVDSDSNSYFQIDAPPVYIIPKNSDVRVVATSSAANTEIIAGIGGYLAKVI